MSHGIGVTPGPEAHETGWGCAWQRPPGPDAAGYGVTLATDVPQLAMNGG